MDATAAGAADMIVVVVIFVSKIDLNCRVVQSAGW